MFYKVGVSVFRSTVQVLLLLGSDFYRDENHNESSEHERNNETLHGSKKLKSDKCCFELIFKQKPPAERNQLKAS